MCKNLQILRLFCEILFTGKKHDFLEKILHNQKWVYSKLKKHVIGPGEMYFFIKGGGGGGGIRICFGENGYEKIFEESYWKGNYFIIKIW